MWNYKIFLFLLFFALFLITNSSVCVATNDWDFSSASDYTFDDTKIEISEGQAQLKDPDNWYNINWPYRKSVTIDNTANPSDLTNYQIQIGVSYDTNMQADFDDIRFTDSNGTTLVDYWLETKVDSSSATFWVEIPSILASSSKTIYFYYGNSGTTSASSGNNTFALFDNFDSYAVNPNFPTVINPKSGASEPASAVLGDGTVLLVGKNLRKSTDNGVTWSAATTIFSEVGTYYWVGATAYLNTIYAVVGYETGTDNYLLFRRSTDGGTNWTNSVQIWHDVDPTIGIDPNVIRLNNGDLLVTYTELSGSTYTIHVYKSTDNGDTWAFLSNVATDNTNHLEDPDIVQLSDNTLLIAYEVEVTEAAASTLHQKISTNNGVTWGTESTIWADDPTADNEPGSYVVISDDEIWFIATTDEDDPGGSYEEAKIKKKISRDRGVTWGEKATITTYSQGYVALTAVLQANDEVRIIAIYKYYSVGSWKTMLASQPETSSTYVFSENWTLSASPAVTNSTFYDGTQSVACNTVGIPNATKSISSSSSGLFRAYVKTNSIGSGPKPLLGIYEGTTKTIRLHFLSGQIKYEYPADTWNTIQSYSADTWYKIEIAWYNNNKADIYVNGIKKITATNLVNNPTSGVNKVYIGSSNASGETYIDQVSVRSYSTSAPLVGAASVEGTAFYSDNPSIVPISSKAQAFTYLSGFSETATKNGGEIKYQISNNGGSTWYWYNFGWKTSNSTYTEANIATDINSNVSTFPSGDGLFLFRAFLNSDGSQFIRLDLVSIIVNPSPTPTTSAAILPTCSEQSPGTKASWLYSAVAQSAGSVLLRFSEADSPVNKYVLEYGTKPGEYPYGIQDMRVNSHGPMTFLVKSLSQNTTYYFRVRGDNGCAVGSWSNEISAKTKGTIPLANQLKIVSSELKAEVLGAESAQGCQVYTVKSGDTLWLIAKNLLGNGSRYQEIIGQNKDQYSTLKESDSLKIGWELKVNCGKQTSTDTQAQGGYDVKVKIVDTTKKPVEGATVTLHSNPQTAKTDKDGIASFTNVEPGDHKVLIAYKNFEGEQSVNLTGDVKEFALNITVEQKGTSISSLTYKIIGVMGLVIIVLLVFLIKLKKKLKNN